MSIFKVLKTFLDILLAVFGLIILLPVLIIIALIVFLTDFDPPFFIQERLGQAKRPFKIIKFRSMRNGEITKVGEIMRKTGIDELPQLLNIVSLEMSFVGPRPLTQADIERLEWTSNYYEARWRMKPGIVGLAQLSPICHKKINWQLDKIYINKHNIGLDLHIILSSILIPFVGKKNVIKWLHKR